MSDRKQYEAARNSVAFYPLKDPGSLRIRGEDRIDFLQRQSTNDLRLLSEGSYLITVLTNPAARILDVLCLVQEGSEIVAITLPGRGPATGSFLQSRVFFMDKVEVIETSGSYTQFDLIGPGSVELLHKLGIENTPSDQKVMKSRIGGIDVILVAMPAYFSLGFRLLAPSAAKSVLGDALREAGAEELDDEVYHLLHVENGLPSADQELSENYTPLEVGLEMAISGDKGCYTGQEVIARQTAYDKVTQSLRGLKTAEEVEVGSQLWFEGKPVGRVTSFALSPALGPIALAVIKRPSEQPGTVLQIGERDKPGIMAEVIRLPFRN